METDNVRETEQQDAVRCGTITKIERQKRVKDRYNLYIDDQYAFSVHEDVLIKHRLVKGAEIGVEHFRAIAQAQERQQAYVDAIRLLSFRLRSEYELKARLKEKGYDPQVAAETLERLRREQYVDDSQFAEQLAMQRIRSQKKGRNWVRQELQHKGLQPEHIAQALEQVDEETEYRYAFELAFKKYRSDFAEDPLKGRRKAAGFLMRRGYSSRIATRVIRELGLAYGELDLEEADYEFE
ncbi:Regulatory protein RecX [Paenibacillus konkukensis]|uniref:Regulatory protein RecX n=1 Tax=Paenibacillus konkukensis TaxID=2020716 RepID=A0ABY4RZS0_9BACL|nr:RecX family transcriptional regulator [Paenibacillus konkukensis]UQZ87413.1 Regulatory protein RecX [Paenibacillus konkukensis]